MYRRSRVLSMLIAACLLLSLAGCGPKRRVALNLSPADTATYKVSLQTIKDFRFEQPSLTPPKIKEEQSGSTVDIVFEQRIEEVQEDGSAIATITLREVTYLVKDKNDIKFDFDSTREADKNRSFAKVLGQSYVIKMSPDGKVEVVDANDALQTDVQGYDGRIAKALFSDERIRERHEVPALPSTGKSVTKRGASWSTVVASPPGLLAPKSFRKTYTLSKVEGPKTNQIATIKMNAEESSEPAAGAANEAGMGVLANLFRTTEVYTGNTVLELATGRIRQYEEKLVATYDASENPQGGPSDKGPDTLMMRFTHSVARELVE